jgi:hypothetical protein
MTARLTCIAELMTMSLLLGACAVVPAPGDRQASDATPVLEATPAPDTTQTSAPEPEAAPALPLPLAAVARAHGDRPLPPAKGRLERYDCMTGVEDVHARIAFEARGGQVTGFSYYSKWKPRTCSIDVRRSDPAAKWRLTPEGATRVQTPIGTYVIRTLPDAYVFEFQSIQRMKVCGMTGTISGTMTVKRHPDSPVCTVAGIMNR